MSSVKDKFCEKKYFGEFLELTFQVRNCSIPCIEITTQQAHSGHTPFTSQTSGSTYFFLYRLRQYLRLAS